MLWQSSIGAPDFELAVMTGEGVNQNVTAIGTRRRHPMVRIVGPEV